ncbi:MAG: hypothetical protein PHV20_03340 [Bacteroidales bacterium]|nr:hypothetical protein [Bacteroidales bacterium]
MDTSIEMIKGIHPGIILERELKKRNIAKGSFAKSINEFPQTIATITKGKRRINPALSLKIEKSLGFEEGYFLILQAYHDIEIEKQKASKDYHPDLSKFRKVVFWDTKMEKIDWIKHKSAVIERIFERGNDIEKKEIIRFYGLYSISSYLKSEELISAIAAESIREYTSNNDQTTL